MIKNYFITGIRNFWRNKAFSLINVLGLSIGISAALVIYLIVHYDLSFDRFEKDGDRIYRVVSDYSEQGEVGHTRGTQAPLIAAARNELTGLQDVIAFRYFNVDKMEVPDLNLPKPRQFKNQENIIFADEHYIDLLPYQWLAGSAGSALNSPGQVVLTEARAKLYFPSLSFSQMIGRRIDYGDSIHTTVSGVVKDLDAVGNTDFSFREFISLATVLENKNRRSNFDWDDWGSTTSDQQLYVKLRPGVTPASIEAGLNKIFNKYQGEDEKKNHFTWSYRLQPLSDVHFNPDYGTFSTIANKPTMYGLLLVAGFLLFLGCINFINLTTAQASQRAREIGIRKTLGSTQKQLIFQFLNETFLITVAATILSLMLAPLLLKIFADFIPEGVHFSMLSIFRQPELMCFLVVLVIAVTLLSGFYPALVLSSLRTVAVLKNQTKSEKGKTRKVLVRQTLTVSQFVIAQAFIMGTLLVSKQIRFLLDKDLGFKKEAIISFATPGSDTSYSRRLFLLDEIRTIPGVAMISLGTDVPASGSTWSSSIKYEDGKKEINTAVEIKYGDGNYLNLFHIPLVAGRNVLPSDTMKEVLINESYAHILGFRHPSEALGKILTWNGKSTPIVGVLKDFHTHALNMEIKPVVYSSLHSKRAHRMIIALQPQGSDGQGVQWKSVIAGVEKMYKGVYPGEDFNSTFLDESIAKFYQEEQKTSNLLRWATGLAIFISCLGLLGLVIYTTNLRTKEIGVRKILGATVTQIVTTLSTDFLKLVFLGIVLATPLAWWAVQSWLQKFAYRTPLSWWVFALSGLAMIGLAVATLSIQTIRAARANPVKSLRVE